jgi:outer membrane lipoprotein SlyB
MSETKNKMHPLIAIAAIAVTLFSLAGLGVMTGFIPTSNSSEQLKREAEAKAAATPAAKPAPAARSNTQPAAPRKPVQVAAAEPAPRPVLSPPVVVARVCHECGVIDSVKVVDQKGNASGIGAVGGAVVGGLIGTQIGSGRGNTAATVIGAAGGALAGNEVEKRVKSSKQYTVTVRMEEGNFRDFTFENEPGYSIGEKVKVVEGRLVRNS